MNKMKTLPKLHLCCANDELRPAMNHLLVTKEFIVASDSHVLIEFKTSELFDQNFIEAMPERFLIHRENWKMLSVKHHYLLFTDSQIEIIKNGFSFFIPAVREEDIGNFPDYEKVFKVEKESITDKIGIKPELLKKLSSAIGSQILHLHFNGEARTIIIKSSIEGVRALIMPAMISD